MKSNLQIVKNYRDNENLRNAYHDFIANVFPSISFREWYSKGFWPENFIPFSILESDKIVSNVSATLMTTILNGKKCQSVQIGAVGTLPEYCNQGLSRELMNYVVNEYKDDIDFFFLHANETVLQFYPKFGFRSIDENLFIAEASIPKANYSARKLNIEVERDYLLLQDFIKNRHILTNIFGAVDYDSITMWHVLNLYQENLYYLENENVIIIKEEKDNALHIIDVLFTKPFDFQLVLPKIIESDSSSLIKYYFPPDHVYFNYDKTLKDKTGLFVLGKFELGNIAFRYPETAVT